jgi:hypothetical protein
MLFVIEGGCLSCPSSRLPGRPVCAGFVRWVLHCTHARGQLSHHDMSTGVYPTAIDDGVYNDMHVCICVRPLQERHLFARTPYSSLYSSPASSAILSNSVSLSGGSTHGERPRSNSARARTSSQSGRPPATSPSQTHTPHAFAPASIRQCARWRANESTCEAAAVPTDSSAPRTTPHSKLEYHSSPHEAGSSTQSDSGFSGRLHPEPVRNQQLLLLHTQPLTG